MEDDDSDGKIVKRFRDLSIENDFEIKRDGKSFGLKDNIQVKMPNGSFGQTIYSPYAKTNQEGNLSFSLGEEKSVSYQEYCNFIERMTKYWISKIKLPKTRTSYDTYTRYGPIVRHSTQSNNEFQEQG
jgi:hypothetical protein